MNPSDAAAIASRFTAFREKYAKITQKALASDARSTPKTISNIETGKILPGPKIVTYLANKYGLNPDWLFTGRGVDRNPNAPDANNTTNMQARIAILERDVKEIQRALLDILKKLNQGA